MSDFQDLLEAQIPMLRRHARALTRDAHRADYLVLDTLLRALMKQDRWEPGTNDRGYSICQRIRPSRRLMTASIHLAHPWQPRERTASAQPRPSPAHRLTTGFHSSGTIQASIGVRTLAAYSVVRSASRERQDVDSEPLELLDALRNGVAAAIKDQLVHADCSEAPDVGSDLFRFSGERPAGAVRGGNGGLVERRFIGDRQSREIAPLGLGQP